MPANTLRLASSIAASTSSLTALALAPGGVEHHDALLGALVDGDVVGARARPGDGQQALGQRHVVHRRRAHQDALGIGRVGADRIVGLGQALFDDIGDRVEGANLLHDGVTSLMVFSNSAMKATRALTPSSGMAL